MPVEAPGYLLEPDAGCMRGLQWRLTGGWPQPLDAVRVARLLEARAGVESTHHPGVLLLNHPDGHQWVVVPRTGRVTVRVHPAVPHEHRKASAQQLARLFWEACSGPETW